jgi:putative transposase
MLSAWPVRRPADWLARVNRPQSAAAEQALRLSLSRGRPFGDADWQAQTAGRLGLETTFRPHGRPRKQADTIQELERANR